MREIGELKWAEDEIHWASREADPAEIPPCDIGELIKDNESLIMKGVFGQPIERSEGQETVQPTGASASEKASVFDLSNYPPPWPIVPFSARTARLQKRIPFHLLPQTLIVHDPWNLLSVNKQDTGSDSSECGDAHDAKEWNPKDDIIRTYHLQLSESGKEKVENELKLRADLDAKCKDIGQRESYTHTLDPMTESEPVSPMVMVFPPLCPPPPESVPEAHLYLSPAHHVGSGNHSVVYNAEWELPRSLLVNDILCQQCMRDKVAEELKEIEKRGEYCPGKPEGDSQQRDPGESPRPAVTRDNKSAKVTTTTEQFSGTAAEIVVGGEPLGIYTIEPPEIVHRTTYDGPVVKVFPEVHWQNPEHGLYCAHIQKSLGCEKVPLTAKVNVVAKLSIQYDPHLANEAENYQSFPTHLSEHWNGYNIIPPLHDPVPVGAVVPQFYGYYVPEQNELGDGSAPTYLSPILLLENCGIPIDPKLIDRDEQQECAALLYRMHEAGWAHGSFYERNILVQPGPLSEWPLIRSASGVKSFRLIDFGRSKELRDSKSRAFEETYADRLFDITGFYHPR
jgi:Lipopolysaccharide kinase (Kdo/WaaP) family